MLQNGILGEKMHPFYNHSDNTDLETSIHPRNKSFQLTILSNFSICMFLDCGEEARDPSKNPHRHRVNSTQKGPRPSNGTLLLWGVSADHFTTVLHHSTEKWKQSLTAKLLSLKSLICIIIYNTWLVAVLKRSKYTKPQWKSRKLIKWY